MGRACAELDRFNLPPPEGISKPLHDWIYDLDRLLKQAKRLKMLKTVREERLEGGSGEQGDSRWHCSVDNAYLLQMAPLLSLERS